MLVEKCLGGMYFDISTRLCKTFAFLETDFE